MSTGRPKDDYPPRSSTTRRRGRDTGPQGRAGDADNEEYEWFKYLGEGRSGGPAGSSGAGGAAGGAGSGLRPGQASARPAGQPEPASGSRGRSGPDSPGRTVAASRNGRDSGSWDRPDTGSLDRPDTGPRDRADTGSRSRADGGARAAKMPPVGSPSFSDPGSYSAPLYPDATAQLRRPERGNPGPAGGNGGRSVPYEVPDGPARSVPYGVPDSPARSVPYGAPDRPERSVPMRSVPARSVPYGAPGGPAAGSPRSGGFPAADDLRRSGSHAPASETGRPGRPGGHAPAASAAAFADPGYLPLDYTGVPHVPAEDSDATRLDNRQPYSDRGRPPGPAAGQRRGGNAGNGYPASPYRDDAFRDAAFEDGTHRDGGNRDVGTAARGYPTGGYQATAATAATVVGSAIPGGTIPGRARPGGTVPGAGIPSGADPDAGDRYAGWMDPGQEQVDLSGTGQWTRANRAWADVDPDDDPAPGESGRDGRARGSGSRTAERGGLGQYARQGLAGAGGRLSGGLSGGRSRDARPSGRKTKPLGRPMPRQKAGSRPEAEPGGRASGRGTEPATRAVRSAVRPPRRTTAPRTRRSAGGPQRGLGSASGLTSSIARVPRRVLYGGTAAVVAALALATYFMLGSSGPAHVISLPAGFAGYVRSPSLAAATNLQSLEQSIVSTASGEVKNVKVGVYEKTTGPGTSAGPQIMGFVVGNLTGSGSSDSMIGGLKSQLSGSFSISPGSLGGQAACAAGTNGGPAECAWADNDTFGVVFSPTMSPSALGSVMVQLRALAEHVAK